VKPLSVEPISKFRLELLNKKRKFELFLKMNKCFWNKVTILSLIYDSLKLSKYRIFEEER